MDCGACARARERERVSVPGGGRARVAGRARRGEGLTTARVERGAWSESGRLHRQLRRGTRWTAAVRAMMRRGWSRWETSRSDEDEARVGAPPLALAVHSPGECSSLLACSAPSPPHTRTRTTRRASLAFPSPSSSSPTDHGPPPLPLARARLRRRPRHGPRRRAQPLLARCTRTRSCSPFHLRRALVLIAPRRRPRPPRQPAHGRPPDRRRPSCAPQRHRPLVVGGRHHRQAPHGRLPLGPALGPSPLPPSLLSPSRTTSPTDPETRRAPAVDQRRRHRAPVRPRRPRRALPRRRLCRPQGQRQEQRVRPALALSSSLSCWLLVS